MIRKTLPLLVAVTAQLVGFFLYSHPLSTDSLLPLTHCVGIAFILVFLLSSLGAWGLCIAQALGFQHQMWLAALSLGSAFLSLLITGLGSIGFIGPDFSALYTVILLLGPVWLLLRKKEFPSLPLSPGMFLPGIAVFLVLMDSTQLRSYWDPLWYHLNAPRTWYESGRIVFDRNSAIFFQAGPWEAHYLWMHELLGGEEGAGLVAAQMGSQWLNAILGYGGSALALAGFLRPLVSHASWLSIATLAGLLSSALYPSPIVAKNDMGSVFWALSGLSLLIAHRASLRNPRLSVGGAVLIGLAVSSKWTLLYGAVPVFLFCLCVYPEMTQGLLKILLGIFLGMCPILSRNFWWTGNPFFPALNGIFHSNWLGPSWRAGMKMSENFDPFSQGANLFKLRAYDVLHHQRLNWVGIFSPVLLFLRDQRLARKVGLLGVAVLISFGGFFAFSGELALYRWMALDAMLLPALGVIVIERLCDKFEMGFRVQYAVSGILIVMLMMLPAMRWSVFSSVFSLKWENPALQVIQHVGGHSLKWLRDNVPGSEKIASINDGKLYYARPHVLVRVWDAPDIDQDLWEARNLKEAVGILRKHGFRYVLNTREFVDAYPNAKVVDALRSLNPGSRAIVFQSGTSSNVIDLEILNREIEAQTD